MTNLNFLSKSGSQSMGLSSVTLALTVGSPSAHRRSIMLKHVAFLLLFLFSFGVGNAWGETLTCTFESVSGKSFPYNDAWALTSGTENTTYHHGGSRCVTLNSSSFNLVTVNKIPGTVTNVTYYAGRTSNNNTSTSVYIETSTDGTNWTRQNTYAISGAGRLDQSNNNWSTVSQSMNVSNCYVRITRIGGGNSTAVRAIDDVTITYTPIKYNVTLNRNGVTETINNVTAGTTLASIQGNGAQGGCSAWEFIGWSKTQRAAQNNSNPMTLVTDVDGAGPYYAVYKHSSEAVNDSKTFNISSIASANSWTNGTRHTPIVIDPVSIESNTSGNNGYYYSNDGSWRLYSSSSPKGTVTIRVDGGSVTSVSSTPSKTFTITDGVATHTVSSNTNFTAFTVNYSCTTYYYSTTATCCTTLGSINGSFS